jgi:GNAT superfamily N-acetyltransferase
MKFVLKEVGYTAIEEIQQLAYRIWPATFSEILSQQQIDYMLDMMYSTASLEKQMKEGIVFLIAFEGTVPVGFVSYELNYKGRTKTKIHKLYLLPEVQGKGYGRNLIEQVSKIARKNKQISLILNVNRFNQAIHFYLKTGFQQVAEESIAIGNGFLMEDIVMELELSNLAT